MPNKKFQVPINLVNLSSDPGTASEGDVYYNTTSDTVKVYANDAWASVQPTFTGYDYEIHVSQTDGNDTTGNGDILNPVASITKALTLVTSSRKTIIVHPGGYTENPSITTPYTTITGPGLIGGNIVVYGTISTNTGCTISGIKMTNLTITTPAGQGNVNILNCEVSGTLTKSSNADYAVLRLCDYGAASITGAGIVAIFGGNPNFTTVNNASANVIIKSAITVSPVLTAGTLSIVDSVVGAAVTNAVTSSASSIITLANSQFLTSTLTGVAPVVLNGFYSILNCVYDKPNSTLVSSSETGGTTNSIDYFQYINADKFITQGGTSSQFVKGDGSLDSSSYAPLAGATFTGAVSGTSLTLSGDLTVNGTTTTINSTTLSIDDKNIEIGSVASPTNTTADGGGITLKGATDKTFNWVNSTSSWTSSENIDLASGKTLKINGVDVLSATSLAIGLNGTTGQITLKSAATGTSILKPTDYNTNALTFTLPATGGTLTTTGQTFYIGSTPITIAQGTGTITSLSGMTALSASTSSSTSPLTVTSSQGNNSTGGNILISSNANATGSAQSSTSGNISLTTSGTSSGSNIAQGGNIYLTASSSGTTGQGGSINISTSGTGANAISIASAGGFTITSNNTAGTINNFNIGATTAGTGKFTTVTATDFTNSTMTTAGVITNTSAGLLQSNTSLSAGFGGTGHSYGSPLVGKIILTQDKTKSSSSGTPEEVFFDASRTNAQFINLDRNTTYIFDGYVQMVKDGTTTLPSARINYYSTGTTTLTPQLISFQIVTRYNTGVFGNINITAANTTTNSNGTTNASTNFHWQISGIIQTADVAGTHRLALACGTTGALGAAPLFRAGSYLNVYNLGTGEVIKLGNWTT